MYSFLPDGSDGPLMKCQPLFWSLSMYTCILYFILVCGYWSLKKRSHAIKLKTQVQGMISSSRS